MRQMLALLHRSVEFQAEPQRDILTKPAYERGNCRPIFGPKLHSDIGTGLESVVCKYRPNKTILLRCYRPIRFAGPNSAVSKGRGPRVFANEGRRSRSHVSLPCVSQCQGGSIKVTPWGSSSYFPVKLRGHHLR